MSISVRHALLFVFLLLVPSLPGAVTEPTDLGLIEETGRRLVQLDVTVYGPADHAAGLAADDFEVSVGGKPIEQFAVDMTCVDPDAISVPVRGHFGAEFMTDGSSPPGLSLMFYFDQYHLTAGGRARAFQVARELVETLIGGPNRATVVSSGRQLRTVAALTSDRTELLRAIDEAENDPAQFDAYPSLEENRVQQVYDAFNTAVTGAAMQKRINDSDKLKGGLPGDCDNGIRLTPAFVGALETQSRVLHEDLEADINRSAMLGAVKAAQLLQREEEAHTRSGLARLSMALAALFDEAPPKAVIYFADTLRPNPGEHYLKLFRNIGPESPRTIPLPTQLESGGPPYQAVIDTAAANGIRLYTVQAQGLVAKTSTSRPPVTQGPVLAASLTGGSQRFKDAEHGLAGFALETGGQVFLGAASEPSQVADRILSDLTCVYLISFDPEGLEEDRPLPVRVSVSRPGVDTRHRARLFVDSEAARAASRLSNAFFNAGSGGADPGVRIVVIPLGFEKGKYQALVQVAVPGSALLSSIWDVGLTLTVNGRVKKETSGRVSVDRAGVPIVFESVMEFPPRPYEITGVAHETTTDQVFSSRIAGQWPDPADGVAALGPIAVLQPTYGAFVRGEEYRAEGSLGHGPGHWVRPDLPTALVGLVCRSRKNARLQVDRRVAGASLAEFEPFEVDDPQERCGVFIDLIQAGTMTSGRFTYEVRAQEVGAPTVEGERELLVITPEEIRLAGRIR